MGFVFIKAFLLSFFRTGTVTDDAIIHKTRIVLNNFAPDRNRVEGYRRVCGFSRERPGIIPISYLQTLFIGLMGKFVTSHFFPISPMGLVHIFQSFDQKRPVATHETLDLACSLTRMTKNQKGIETLFSLEVLSGSDLVWEGTSTLFTRHPGKTKKTTKKTTDLFLEKKETIAVPSGTGRKYASVSGDYNPFHLYTILAKFFGFKKAIAHGMWSLAQVIASLEKKFGPLDAAHVEASFKLPIFMPAVTALGYDAKTDDENCRTRVNFELRDAQKGLPHLKGTLLNTRQGS